MTTIISAHIIPFIPSSIKLFQPIFFHSFHLVTKITAAHKIPVLSSFGDLEQAP
jgi:hypothetical protein